MTLSRLRDQPLWVDGIVSEPPRERQWVSEWSQLIIMVRFNHRHKGYTTKAASMPAARPVEDPFGITFKDSDTNRKLLDRNVLSFYNS